MSFLLTPFTAARSVLSSTVQFIREHKKEFAVGGAVTGAVVGYVLYKKVKPI